MQDRRGIKKKFYAKYTFAKHCNLVVLRKAELRITCFDLSIYSTRRTSNWYLGIKNGECCPGTKFPKVCIKKKWYAKYILVKHIKCLIQTSK